jgi:hypothetical protein
LCFSTAGRWITGELVGLTGTMTLQIADGIHSYDLAYTLPEPS